jgi:hypothetical protein
MKTAIRLAFALSLLLNACLETSRPQASSPAIHVEGFEQQLVDACGLHVIYPINAKCIAVMGSVGPLLLHRSDLVMGIWRSCPYESPCYRVAAQEPACNVQTGAAHARLFGADNEACRRAQHANYSCAALMNDLGYADHIEEPHEQAGADYECQRAKAALTAFDAEIDRTRLRIQWYRTFARQGF